jgi:hypothetical protein
MAKSSAEMVSILKEALQTGAAVVSVTIDGQIVQYNRKDAREELLFWERRAAREAGRPRFIPVSFSGIDAPPRFQ